VKLGVLAVQGDVREHLAMLRSLGVRPIPVFKERDMAGLAGMVLPGGESTAMWSLMQTTGLGSRLAKAISAGLPALGTCAGMVLLAREIVNWPRTYFGHLDIALERNGTGRQADSFEALVQTGAERSVPGVFIRAPVVRSVGAAVRILGTLADKPVWVQQEQLVAASFHPELTGDPCVHEHFIGICRKER